MSLLPPVCVVAIALLALVGSTGAADGPWDRTLQDGSQIRIDPGTGRARVTTPRQADTLLWDGVHKLEDGSTLIVREGVVVPDRAMLDARRAVAEAAPDSASPCVVLERKSCGLYAECGGDESCTLARQLAAFEAGGRLGTSYSQVQKTLGQCREALALTDTFKVCAQRTATLGSSPCLRLAQQVCGTAGQCTDTQPCTLARQLVEMEYEELLTAPHLSAPTQTGARCEEAKSDQAVFTACEAPQPGGTGSQ